MLGLRLNRTSVGLKQGHQHCWGNKTMMPQSNQRGIETPQNVPRSKGACSASIEPAWD